MVVASKGTVELLSRENASVAAISAEVCVRPVVAENGDSASMRKSVSVK